MLTLLHLRFRIQTCAPEFNMRFRIQACVAELKHAFHSSMMRCSILKCEHVRLMPQDAPQPQGRAAPLPQYAAPPPGPPRHLQPRHHLVPFPTTPSVVCAATA